MVIHLIDELAIYGLEACRWMYPIKQCLCVLKKYVKNHSLPEGCMAEGYIMEEVLGLYTKYLQGFPYTQRWLWDDEDKARVSGVHLAGRSTTRQMAQREFHATHMHVITNSAIMEPYYMCILIFCIRILWVLHYMQPCVVGIYELNGCGNATVVAITQVV